ncbi:hypothetical protein J6590_060054, partial [Homalodisca vitripennis]
KNAERCGPSETCSVETLRKLSALRQAQDTLRRRDAMRSAANRLIGQISRPLGSEIGPSPEMP